jgi:MoaA/NifB/PqqE/SkfB family radical SAM enzyme
MNDVPWRITFDTNPDDCNLKCVMCEEHSPFSPKQAARIARGEAPRRMDIRVLEQVLEELKDSPPREIIPSTMGEPLLYQHFESVLDLCRRYGIRLNLTTNGTFPRGGANEWARKIVPLGSDVKISFNGIQAETQESIMQNSRFESVIENVRTFIAVRDNHAATGGNYCSVTLQVTFMEQNLAELPAIVSLAANLNVDRVKGHHLWVHFSEMKGQDLRRSPDSVARWNQVLDQCRHTAATCSRPSGAQVKLENFTPLTSDKGQEVPSDWECPFLGREAWINNSGRFDPCCAPDDLRKSLGSFGTVQDQGFLGIWHGQNYRALVSGYKGHSLCKTCLMRRQSTTVNSP